MALRLPRRIRFQLSNLSNINHVAILAAMSFQKSLSFGCAFSCFISNLSTQFKQKTFSFRPKVVSVCARAAHCQMARYSQYRPKVIAERAEKESRDFEVGRCGPSGRRHNYIRSLIPVHPFARRRKYSPVLRSSFIIIVCLCFRSSFVFLFSVASARRLAMLSLPVQFQALACPRCAQTDSIIYFCLENVNSIDEETKQQPRNAIVESTEIFFSALRAHCCSGCSANIFRLIHDLFSKWKLKEKSLHLWQGNERASRQRKS